MKKVFLFSYFILYITVFSLKLDITFDSDFAYQLIYSDGNKAYIKNIITGQEFFVKKGDKLKNYNIGKGVVLNAENKLNDKIVTKEKIKLMKKLKNFFKNKKLKVPDFSYLKLSPFKYYIDVKNKIDLNSLIVKHITKDAVILYDYLSDISYVLHSKPKLKPLVITGKYFSKKLKVLKIDNNKIYIDGKKEKYYKNYVKFDNYRLYSAYDDKYVYFYLEYYLKKIRPVSDGIYIKNPNGEYYYSKLSSPFELYFFISEARNFVSFFKKMDLSKIKADLWHYNYFISKQKYLEDDFCYFSNGLLGNYENISFYYKEKRKYVVLSLKKDKGISPYNSAYKIDVFSLKNSRIPYVFPYVINLKTTFSQRDVVFASKYNIKNYYFSGKLVIELKRRLNTGHEDDIIFEKGKTYILNISDLYSGIYIDKCVELFF